MTQTSSCSSREAEAGSSPYYEKLGLIDDAEELLELAIEGRAPHPEANFEPEVVERVLRVAHEKADAAHHRLPQFYLKKFAGKSRKIEVLNPWAGSKELLAPREAFAEQGYYTGRGEKMEPLALVEVLYEIIEDAAAKPIRRLSKGDSPTGLSLSERAKVAEFLSTQITRGESFKQTTGDFMDEVTKVAMKMKMAHHGDSWADWAGDEGRAMTPEQFEEAIDNNRFKVVPSAEHLLQLRLVAVGQIAEIFVNFSWHCVRFEHPCLFTCEEPVTYWREPTPATAFLGIGASTTDEVRIALSPRLALVLVHPRWRLRDSEVLGGRREAALLNFGTLFFHSGFPIVRSPDVAHHPLPTAAFTESRAMPQFNGGPIIRA